MTTRFSQKQVLFLISIALIAMTLIAFEPIRHNGFVNYDDDKYITANPDIKSGLTWESFGRAFTQSHYFMWHPLTTLSHILDCKFFGLNPVGHHFVGVLIHTVNALLTFWILTKITGATWPSAFVAAVFALHSLQVESVAWAAERKTVLSGLFWFLTIGAYVWYTKRPVIGRYVLLFVVYGLCIMTKPVVVTLPLVLLLLDYWPLNRLNSRRSILTSIIEKIPLFALSAILSAITVIVQRQSEAVVALDTIPLDIRIANTFISCIRYIGKTIWPSRLAVFYPHPLVNLSNLTVAACALLFVLISVISIYVGRRRRYVTVGWLWYVGTLVPVIGLVQSGGQAMANRYMYIPILGLLIIITWFVKEHIANHPRLRYIAAASAVVVLSIAIIFTRIQVKRWENSFTLFEYALRVTENNFLAENNYGAALLEKGRAKEAEAHLRSAIRMYPAFFEAYANLGSAYNQLGKYKSAIRNWTRAVDLSPNDASVLNNLAWLLATGEKVSAEDANKAIDFAERVCKITGYKNPHLLDTQAAAYAAAGRFDDAIKTANQAINIAKTKREEKLADEIWGRIRIYQSGQRYHQR
jgi:Tfp pilus assembly protein PilF